MKRPVETVQNILDQSFRISGDLVKVALQTALVAAKVGSSLTNDTVKLVLRGDSSGSNPTEPDVVSSIHDVEPQSLAVEAPDDAPQPVVDPLLAQTSALGPIALFLTASADEHR